MMRGDWSVVIRREHWRHDELVRALHDTIFMLDIRLN